MSLAIYPGTFDPITFGHLDVLRRASQIFDHVVLVVAPNEAKNPFFTVKERLKLIETLLPEYPNTSVKVLEGLTVEYARMLGAKAVVRGLRAVSDFEYEFQMAQMNRHLEADIETIFLMPGQDYFYTSSNIVKSVAQFSPERVSHFVPPNVLEAMKKKFDKLRSEQA